MEKTTQLLWRQRADLEGRNVLIVEANDPALMTLQLNAQVHVHADDFTVGAQQWAPQPNVPEGVDLLILPLPKSVERLRFLLNSLAGALQTPCELWLIGPAKGGIRGALKHLQAHVDEATLVESARHCKLYRGMLQPGQVQTLSAWGQRIPLPGNDLEVISYPGVFSHGRLDEGSRLLLEALEEGVAEQAPGRALDIGCGAGALSVFLARRGWQMQAVDVSASAVAATRKSLEHNGLQGNVEAGDLFSSLHHSLDMLVTNPPFHIGRQRTMDVSQRLIAQAPQYLRDGGALWLVANRELPYVQWLDKAFRHVQVARETRRFRVYRAVV